MKNRDIYNIISGIDEKYRTSSGDFKKISGDFRRAKIHRTEAFVSLAASFVLVVFAGLNVYDKNSAVQRDDMLSPSYSGTYADEQPFTEVSTAVEIKVTAKTDGVNTTAVTHTKTATASTAVNKKNGTEQKNGNKDNFETAENKAVSKTQTIKTTVSSGTLTNGKTKPVKTTAAHTDKNNTAVSDVNECFEDPILDEIVMSNNYYDYTYLTGNRTYISGEKMMDADSVGEKIEKNIVLRKYDREEEKIYYMTADTYRINNISDSFAVAVKYPKINTFYLYKNVNYSCDTFGQLMDDLDFEHNLSVNDMSEFHNGVLYGFTDDYDKDIVRKFIFENKNAEYLSNVSYSYSFTFHISLDMLNIHTDFTPDRAGHFTLGLGNGQAYNFKLSREAFQQLMDAYNIDYPPNIEFND